MVGMLYTYFFNYFHMHGHKIHTMVGS